MPVLTLLRHAKSSWDDPVERDFDRPLNGRGWKAAERMGHYLAAEGLVFDQVLASPALRVKQTIEGVEKGLGQALGPHYDRRIYMASGVHLMDLVQAEADGERVLLIGHNPGLEDLLFLLVPDDGAALRREAEAKYPTATLAEITLDAPDWGGLREGCGRLTRFVRPRDLDPALGPDA
ncbi:MAG: SixA phosphatase family protein [Thermaurantiacus sp.]